MRKRLIAMSLAAMLFVTPVFKPTNISGIMTKMRSAGYTIGQEIGKNVVVNVDVSSLLANPKF